MHPRPPLPALALLALSALLPLPSAAQPVVHDPAWSLIRTIEFAAPQSACFNPLDGQIYVGRRGTSSDGLYRIHPYGFAILLAAGSDPAGVVADPDSGHVFFSEDYGGVVYRVRPGIVGRATWVSGFHSGDDDPIGLAIAPAGYTGGVLSPGEALVVDRGYSGADEVWRWSPDTAEGEVLVHADSGLLVDAVDVSIDEATVYIVDTKEAASGVIYVMGAGGALTPLATSGPIADPLGIAADPATGALIVLDSGADRIVTVDPGSGTVGDLATGFSFGADAWAGVDVSPDGRQLVVSDDTAGRIYVFARCDATGRPDLDCDGNGVVDACDIALGAATDCNANGVPDACDLVRDGDCNGDGVPDDCPVCPPVELVFAMDTSTSMDDEGAALCASMSQVVAYLQGRGVEVIATLLGIANTPGGIYACLTDNVLNVLGDAVPGSPPPEIATLNTCPGGVEVSIESWGQAAAVVAGLYPWRPAGESVRLVIPLGDEGPWCGDPVTANDNASVTNAVAVAQANGVFVSPITGSGSSAAVIALAQQLADGTGGEHFSSTTAATDIAEAIADLVLGVCAQSWDCNGNSVPDECDIASGTSLDLNGNGRPDECEAPVGVPETRPPRGRPQLLQNHPNPFNPATTIRFHLPAPGGARLAVYALDGRRVATLVDGGLPAGTHAVTWHGRDDRGRPVASGAYVCRLTAGASSASIRMVMIR